MHKRKIIFVLLMLLQSFYDCSAQKTIYEIAGVWKVKNIKSLIPGSIALTVEEYEECEAQRENCLTSNVLINKDSIVASTADCSFYDCRLLKTNLHKVKIVDAKEGDIDPFLEDKLVSRSEMEFLLDSEHSSATIDVIYTNCPTGYGDFRTRIILLNDSSIIIYNYHNAIILERQEE